MTELTRSDNLVRVIVKEPDERWGHTQDIPNTLEEIQWLVKGRFETADIGRDDAIMLVNEEWRIRGMQENIHCQMRRWGCYFDEVIGGNVVMIGTAGEEFCDCPIEWDEWKMMLKEWGN